MRFYLLAVTVAALAVVMLGCDQTARDRAATANATAGDIEARLAALEARLGSLPDPNMATLPLAARIDAIEKQLGEAVGSKCTPNALFCDGNTLYRCTRNGHDGIVPIDCSKQGTESNPSVCATEHCEAGEAACCQRTKLRCGWVLTAPLKLVGSSTDGVAGLPGDGSCAVTVYPTSCGGVPQIGFGWEAQRSRAMPDVCKPGNIWRLNGFVINAVDTPVGKTVHFDRYGLNVFIRVDDVVSQCSSFNGTVRVDSLGPEWKAMFDLKCNDDPSLAVVGTFAGWV